MTSKPKPALTPKLRFPEFRDEPGWREKLLQEAISPVVREKLKPTVPYTGLGVRSHGKGTFVKACEDPRKNIMDYLYEVKPDDLIVNITFAWEGAIAIAKPQDNGALVSHRFPTFTFIRDVAIPDFFQYIIYFKNFVYQLGVISPGGAGRNRVLNKNDFIKIKTFLPKVNEQQKIADCLRSMNKQIDAEHKKLDALKAHKKGLMQELFPRESESQPRLRFPEFNSAGEWEESPLSKFILSLDAGVSVNAGDRPANKTELGVLKTSAVSNGIFEPLENKVVLVESEQSRLREPVRGETIIISRMNTPTLVGANAYVESSHENLFLPDRLWAAKPREGVSMRFLAFILGSEKGRAALSKLAKGSSGSMRNITKPDVLAFSVLAPTPDEQQRIADCLTSLDALIAAQTRKLERLKTHMKGLMQQLFPSLEGTEA